MNRFVLASPMALAVAIFAGCASAPPPTEQMAVGRKAVERAAGTPEVVQWAPSELERARMKLGEAERAMANRDYDQARRAVDEAEADARLAEARAGARKNDRAVAEVNQAIRGMREELARRPG